MQLDDGERNDFTSRMNDLFDDKEIGTVLGNGEEDVVKETLTDLEKEELTIVMKFLIEEEVIEFEC